MSYIRIGSTTIVLDNSTVTRYAGTLAKSWSIATTERETTNISTIEHKVQSRETLTECLGIAMGSIRSIKDEAAREALAYRYLHGVYGMMVDSGLGGRCTDAIARVLPIPLYGMALDGGRSIHTVPDVGEYWDDVAVVEQLMAEWIQLYM